MSNQPVSLIVFAASFQRYLMAHIPIFTGHDLHLTQMADATVTHKNVSPHFGCDTDALH